jgi:hypothetical protein
MVAISQKVFAFYFFGGCKDRRLLVNCCIFIVECLMSLSLFGVTNHTIVAFVSDIRSVRGCCTTIRCKSQQTTKNTVCSRRTITDTLLRTLPNFICGRRNDLKDPSPNLCVFASSHISYLIIQRNKQIGIPPISWCPLYSSTNERCKNYHFLHGTGDFAS